MKRQALPLGLHWRGETIHIRTRVHGERIRCSCKTSSVRKAKRMLDKLVGKCIEEQDDPHRVGATKPKRVLFRTFVDAVLEEMEAAQAAKLTIRRYRTVLYRFDDFMTERLRRPAQVADIKPDHVMSYKVLSTQTPRTRNGHEHGLKKLPSPRTVCNELDFLRTFFKKAVKRGLIAVNPEAGVGRIKDAYVGRVRYMSYEESERLVTAAYEWDTWTPESNTYGPLLGDIMEMYLRTGMRRDELKYLTVDDVVLNDVENYIVIRRKAFPLKVCLLRSAEQVDAFRKGQLAKKCWPSECHDFQVDARTIHFRNNQLSFMLEDFAWRPKTRDRRIPVSPGLKRILQRVLKQREQILGESLVEGVPWLIPDKSGLPWRFKMGTILECICARIHLEPSISPHVLRHTFATKLRRKGVNIETIQRLLGHSNVNQTMIYAHFTMDEASRAIGLIDD